MKNLALILSCPDEDNIVLQYEGEFNPIGITLSTDDGCYNLFLNFDSAALRDAFVEKMMPLLKRNKKRAIQVWPGGLRRCIDTKVKGTKKMNARSEFFDVDFSIVNYPASAFHQNQARAGFVADLWQNNIPIKRGTDEIVIEGSENVEEFDRWIQLVQVGGNSIGTVKAAVIYLSTQKILLMFNTRSSTRRSINLIPV